MHANDPVTALESVAGRWYCSSGADHGSRRCAVDSRSFASIRGFPRIPLSGTGIPEPVGRANAVERDHVLLAFDHPGRAPRHRSPDRWDLMHVCP